MSQTANPTLFTSIYGQRVLTEHDSLITQLYEANETIKHHMSQLEMVTAELEEVKIDNVTNKIKAASAERREVTKSFLCFGLPISFQIVKFYHYLTLI